MKKTNIYIYIDIKKYRKPLNIFKNIKKSTNKSYIYIYNTKNHKKNKHKSTHKL